MSALGYTEPLAELVELLERHEGQEVIVSRVWPDTRDHKWRVTVQIGRPIAAVFSPLFAAFDDGTSFRLGAKELEG